MGKARGPAPVSGQLTAVASGKVTALVTTPFLVYGSDTLRLNATVRQLAGNFSGQFRYRTFVARMDEPSSWTTGSVNLNAADEYGEDFSLTSIGNVMWIQAGLGVGATSGVAEAFATLRAQVKGDGAMLASQTFDVQPDTNSGQAGYYPLKGRFPVLGLQGLMFAAVLTGVGGTFQWNVAWRQIESDADNPGAWTDLLGSSASASANGSWNSGDLSVSPGTNAWAEVALKVPSNNARALVQLFVAGRY